jgi:hypothetical protein
MSIHRWKLTILISLFFGYLLTNNVSANHKDGHVSEGVGQIDTTQYACNGLGATECMLMKLDRIERKLGCPLDDYLADTCPYSPADTTATFCISQGREGALGANWSIIPYMEGELGVGWPQVGWGKLTGKVENPLFLGPFPIPTELSIGGSASLGRNFDICIEVPLVAAEHLAGVERISDAEVIDRIVRQINEPPEVGPASKSKFQRRLGRLSNYSIFRVPGTNRFGAAAAQANTSDLARIMGDDGESEFDSVEDAIDRLMSGDWQIPENGGPLAVLKSPIVDELRTVLEVPDPVQNIIDDPDIILGRVFEIGSLSGGQGSQSTPALFPGGLAVCNAFGFNDDLQTRFAGIGAFCDLFSVLPSFGQTTGIFDIVATINSIIAGLHDKIRDTACDIAWTCKDEDG